MPSIGNSLRTLNWSSSWKFSECIEPFLLSFLLNYSDSAWIISTLVAKNDSFRRTMAPPLLWSWYNTWYSGDLTPTKKHIKRKKGKPCRNDNDNDNKLDHRLLSIFRWQIACAQRTSSPRWPWAPNDAGGPVLQGSGAWTRAPPRQPQRRAAPGRTPSWSCY